MNAMTEAFIKAGAKVPTIAERLWRTIKEEPGLTAAQLHKRHTAIPRGSVSSQLAMMEQRGMVYVKGTKGQGPRGTTKAYYTDMETYQRLPAPERTTHQAPPPAPAAETNRQVVDVSIDLDSLTIREARALYLKLKELFT